MPASVRAIFVQEVGKNRTFLYSKKRNAFAFLTVSVPGFEPGTT